MNGAESLVRTLVKGGVDVCFVRAVRASFHLGTVVSHPVPVMDEIFQFFASRPVAQRAFLAFTIALFAACAAQVSAHP